MDLEKASDKIYWLALWLILRIYGVVGNCKKFFRLRVDHLLKGIQTRMSF